MKLTIAFAGVLVLLMGGCAGNHVNPSFAVSEQDAERDWERMSQSPKAPARPVVIIGGYADIGLAPTALRSRLSQVLGEDVKIVQVDVGLTTSMDACRERLIRRVDDALGSNESADTEAVDVVAVSMGGLVARYAATPRTDTRRLHIVRLFTIATPHRGAALAGVPTFESRVVDMRAGSAMLKELDTQPRDYELIPYARLRDRVVGDENTSPPEMEPWWVDTPNLESAHLQAFQDPRILADIARRLRDEEPFTQEPASPLPTSQEHASSISKR